MASLYRFTPKRTRAPLQAAAVTAASSAAGVRLLSRPRLVLTPELPGAEDIVVVPGNERTRLFDLRKREVLVLLEPGFDRARFASEVAQRRGHDGPWAPILECDVDQGWFVEPYMPGYTIPRCPPWYPTQRLLHDAMVELARWQAAHPTGVSARARAEQIRPLVADVAPDVSEVAHALLDALASSDLGTERSHGDLQPGNVYVERSSRRTRIFDWEYAAVRYCGYDAMVFELNSRFPAGLADRARRFLAEGFRSSARELVGAPEPRAARELLLRAFMVEELAWHAQRGLSLSDPARDQFHGELRALARDCGAK